MNLRRHGGALAGALLTSVLVVTVSWSAPASAASAVLSADAETGTLAGFGATGGASAVAAAARAGSYGYRVTGAASPGFVQWNSTDVEQGHEYASVSAMVRVNSRSATEPVDLVSLKNNNGVHHFDVFLTPDNRIMWDLHQDNAGFVTGATLGTWYLIEAKVFFGGTTYTADVRINGTAYPQVTSPGMVPTTARGIWFGTDQVRTHQQDYDNLELTVGETDPGWIGPSVPTVGTQCSNLVLKGQVTPAGDTAEWRFEYGSSATYNKFTPWTTVPAGSGPVAVSATVEPTTTKTYYRLVSRNLAGTAAGPMKTETCGTS